METSRQDGKRTLKKKIKKPRHTVQSRFEATRRERLRVQEIRLAYKSLQMALNIPTERRPRYLHILESAIAYIRYLEDKLGFRSTQESTSVIECNEVLDAESLINEFLFD
uniref:Transcription factor JellyD1 n=1 Tax=Podocoryna carnea TaxID=6096 RepID=Q8I7T5_PODCA|nr:transcription factor JellyD1 [Podocoryna carnea]